MGCFGIDMPIRDYILKDHTWLNPKEYSMNVDQHLKVAQWHIEQARLHATVEGGHKCGCPMNDDYARMIEQVENGNIEDEGH